MQVSFLFFALVSILLIALVFGSITLFMNAYSGDKLQHQPQKIAKNRQYGRYQEETNIWERHR